MTRGEATRHRLEARKRRRGALALLFATVSAVALGAYAGGSEPVTAKVPDYVDERWQDPSGYPYCTIPDDGLRPCINAQTQVVTS